MMSVTLIPLDIGLTLILDRVPWASSVSYELSIPGGHLIDPADRLGLGLLLIEHMSRGGGEFDSKALQDAYDEFGIRRDEACYSDRFVFGATCLGEHLGRALELLSFQILTPNFDKKNEDSAKEVLLLEIEGLADSPGLEASIQFGKLFYPDPLGRSPLGESEHIKSIRLEELVNHLNKAIKAGGSFLSIAGDFDERQVREQVLKFFKDWGGDSIARPEIKQEVKEFKETISRETAQSYFRLGFAAPNARSEHLYSLRVIESLLSGGSFGRLFSEVREKRGLVYTINARYQAGVDTGAVIVSGSTTPDRLSETLSVSNEVFDTLFENLGDEELARAKKEIVCQLILGEEPVEARATSNLSDMRLFGTIRPVEEVIAGINAVTKQNLENSYLACNRLSTSILTLGKEI